MTADPAELVVLLALMGLLGWAIYTDTLHFLIPNRISIGIVALWPAWVLAAWPEVDPLRSILMAAIVFMVGFTLFSRGVFGGGDAKLLAALALWAGPGHILTMGLVTSIAGGGVALVYLAGALIRRRQLIASTGTPVPLSIVLGEPVPYGIAIAVGGLSVALALAAG